MSCATPTVLQDSQVPVQLAVGEHKATEGRVLVVEEDKPRFAVSQGYIFESAIHEENSFDLGKVNIVLLISLIVISLYKK